MVEAPRERRIDVEGAAKTDASEHLELAAALQQQADNLQEVLVPADGDAVLGDAAEPGHHPLVEPGPAGV